MHLDHSAVLPPRSFDQSCFCPMQKKKREKDCAGLLSDNGPFYREVGFVYTAHWYSEACRREEEWADSPVGRTIPFVMIRQEILLKYESNGKKTTSRHSPEFICLIHLTADTHLLRNSIYSVCLMRPVLIMMVWKHWRSMAHSFTLVRAAKKRKFHEKVFYFFIYIHIYISTLRRLE